jgi:hypothetical protein
MALVHSVVSLREELEFFRFPKALLTPHSILAVLTIFWSFAQLVNMASPFLSLEAFLM